MNKYYKSSGKFSPLSFLLLIIISFTAFPVLGLLYAYAIWYIPFFYINFLITAAFGYAVGFLISRAVIKPGKVRNGAVGLMMGLTGGFIALYFHWAVWVDLAINAGEHYGNAKIGITISNIKVFQVFQLALNPDVLFGLIEEISRVGTWGFRSHPVNGWFLVTIWIIEALIVMALPAIMAYFASRKPFCETSGSWFKEKELKPFTYIEDTKKAIADLENEDIQFFKNLAIAENTKDNHSIFTLYFSENEEYYLTIKNKTATKNSKGETEFNDNEFIEYISINRPLAEGLMAK